MKQIILFVHLIGLSISAKLDNTYLPPAHAKSAAGSHLLTTPFQGTTTNTGRYQTPHGFSTPGRTYPTANLIHPQSGLTNVPSAAASQGHGSFNGPLGKSSYAHGADNILRYNNQNNGDGSYEFDFETENKISQKEVGHLENIGTDSESNVVQGAYSYVAPNGQTVAVNYIADENGFRTSADGVPQSLHSQNLNRGYGSHRSDGRIPYSGYQNGNQNANNYYGGSGFTNLGRYNVPGSHETGGQFGIAPHGRQNLKTLGQYDGLNQGVSGPYARHQINRQYLPPGSSVHTGY